LNLDRRTLLIGGGAGVGLVVAYALWPHHLRSDLPLGSGQGVWTALPQIVADELGAAWETIAVEPAPFSAAYANPLAKSEGWLEDFGTLREHLIASEGRMRITAGATSVRAFEQPLREAAAIARTMLAGAAADRWNVNSNDCDAADGFVINDGRTLTFGELAEEAADRTPPHSATFRTSTKGRLIGQPLQRLDGPAKAEGSFRFGGDVRLPRMAFASARIAPPEGRLTGFDRGAIKQFPGVQHVVARDRWIAIVADNWWTAERALKAAHPKFNGIRTQPDPRSQFEQALASGPTEEWLSIGDYDAATRGMRALAATYYTAPSQHLGLEPLTATARLSGETMEIWAPSQAPGLARAAAGDAIFYPMPVGEPAGRALEADAVPIATELSRLLDQPVQVTLSQSSSQNHDRTSPGAMAKMTALPGAGGITAAWQMRIATSDGLGSALARLGGVNRPQKLGQTALEGSLPPYSVPNLRIQAINVPIAFTAGYMRGSPQREMAFFTESFIDELARAAGLEPLAFRMSMLGGNGRLARCLQGAARLAAWDGGGAGSTMGIAGCSAYGSHIGLVASASIDGNQKIKVHRLLAAVDCGRVVNSNLVTQGIESALIWALGQATTSQPEWVAGMPRARPFGETALPRIGEVPEIVVEIISSSEPPGGVNGLGATVLAPAVANAIFAGSGKRMRSLPFDPMATA
jgi:isoquinoline 1-oxidoreductase beta subunit